MWLERLTWVLASTLVACLIVEGLLRLAPHAGLLLLDLEMWRYAKQVKQESSWPGLVEEPRPNASGTFMGVRIRTDAHGFRLPDLPTERARRPDDRTVAVLGDSCTLGWGVSEGSTFADLLEKRLNEDTRRAEGRGFTVRNAGIGNSNTSMQLERYRRDIRPWHPEWLVLGFFINDAEPDPVPSREFLVRHSLLAALVSLQLQFRTQSRYRDYQTYYRALYTEPAWERLTRVLDEFGRALGEDRVPATVVLIPEMHDPRGFGPFADIYGRVADLARASGFEVLDASRDFAPGPGNRYWVTPGDSHPDAEAQAILAEALAHSRHLPRRPEPEPQGAQTQ